MHKIPVTPVGSNIGVLYQKLYIQQNVLLRMGEFVVRNCRADLKRPINGICCTLLVPYIVMNESLSLRKIAFPLKTPISISQSARQ